MEIYLFASAIVLFMIGVLALVISLMFRFKFRELEKLSKKLSANVFNRTFVIFSPYSETRKIIHSFLSIIPIIAGISIFIISFLLFRFIVGGGLLLTLFIILIGLDLVIIEDAVELYSNSKIFIKKLQSGGNLGVGDIKVVQVMKHALPKLSKYYLGISIVFIISAVFLPHIWSVILQSLIQFTNLIFNISSFAGIVGAFLVAFTIATIFAIVQRMASIIKDKLLSY